MRGKILVLGLILIALGFFLYSAGQNTVKEGRTVSGQFKRALSEEAQQSYQAGGVVKSVGMAIAPIGFVLVGVGLVTGRK